MGAFRFHCSYFRHLRISLRWRQTVEVVIGFGNSKATPAVQLNAFGQRAGKSGIQSDDQMPSEAA
jgi:hypothetical protein